MFRCFLNILCAVVLPVCLFAQTNQYAPPPQALPDTANKPTAVVTPSVAKNIKAPYVFSTSRASFQEFDNPQYTQYDTTLGGFQRVKPALNPKDPQRYLGTMISPMLPFYYSPFKDNNLRVGLESFRGMEIDPNKLNFFRAKKRYTNVSWHTGRYSEQILDVLHAQNITPLLNMGFGIRRGYTRGMLARQLSYSSNFYGFGSFQTLNKRYTILASAAYNYVEMDANGGLVSDSLFEKTGRLSDALPIKLASSSINYTSQSAYLYQHFDVGTKSETLNTDSTITTVFKPLLRLSHSLDIYRQGFLFTDQYPFQDALNNQFFNDNGIRTNPIFNTFYLNPDQTIDTTGNTSITNRVGISTVLKQELYRTGIRQYFFSVGGNVQQLRYKQQFLKNTYNNTYVDATFKTLVRSGLNTELQGAYNTSGLYKENYNGTAYVFYSIDSGLASVGVKVQQQKASQDLILQNYVSNNFMWNNSFTPSTYSKISFLAEHKKYKLSLEAGIMDIFNPVYINKAFVPVQYTKHYKVFQAKLSKDFSFSRFVFSNNLIYQSAENYYLLNIPEWTTYHSFYYSNKAFKKAALIQIGIDAYYRSAYYGNAYMPSIGLFYIQDKTKLGNYPLFDLFLNLKVKSFKAFVKYEYLNKGLFGKQAYYDVPNYPMQNRVVRFGVSWSFYD